MERIGYYYDERRRLKERPPEKRRRLPRHVIRELNKAPRGAGFVCPVCKVRFDLAYGTLGKPRWNLQARYYCKDCAKAAKGFMKTRAYT